MVKITYFKMSTAYDSMLMWMIIQSQKIQPFPVPLLVTLLVGEFVKRYSELTFLQTRRNYASHIRFPVRFDHDDSFEHAIKTIQKSSTGAVIGNLSLIIVGLNVHHKCLIKYLPVVRQIPSITGSQFLYR